MTSRHCAAAMIPPMGTGMTAANDDGRAAPPLRLVSARKREAKGTGVNTTRRLMLAFLIWGGVLPPEAGGLSDYLDDDMLGLMVRAALRRTLWLWG